MNESLAISGWRVGQRANLIGLRLIIYREPLFVYLLTNLIRCDENLIEHSAAGLKVSARAASLHSVIERTLLRPIGYSHCFLHLLWEVYKHHVITQTFLARRLMEGIH